MLFIPSHSRDGEPTDQNAWVEKALAFLGEKFHGATAFPKAHGVWRDDERGGQLIFDEPVIIHCYTNLKLLKSKSIDLGEFLTDMGRQTAQGAVGFVINNEYFEIPFPLD